MTYECSGCGRTTDQPPVADCGCYGGTWKPVPTFGEVASKHADVIVHALRNEIMSAEEDATTSVSEPRVCAAHRERERQARAALDALEEVWLE